MVGFSIPVKHAENSKNLVSFTGYLLEIKVDGVFLKSPFYYRLIYKPVR